ncbi:hypothetical protein F4677DRAFT_420464 [Hypoxylon crocopeplum]|nr:hypothetical protein F4677DRAFT_420464 [Hypoxylon crocopeplum]
MSLSTTGMSSEEGSSTATGTTGLSLPPQITPYTPPPDVDCAISVYCKFLTYWYYVGGKHQLSGMGCAAVNSLEVGVLGYRTECFPEGYYTIFDNLLEEIRLIPGTPTESGDSSTLAYPGTACVSGWTVACTVTLKDSIDTYTQAWCCPPGSWSCALTEHQGLGADRPITGRHCSSLMTESTDIYMTWDPPYVDGGDSQDYYTWTVGVTSEPTEYAATIYQRVFPLQWTAGASNAPGVQPSAFDGGVAVNTTGPVNEASVAVISKGAIAGISVGAVVFIFGVIWGIAMFYRRRQMKNGVAGTSSSGPNAPPSERPVGDKPELEGSPMAPAVPRAELDAQHLSPTSRLDGSGAGSQRETVSPLSPLSPNQTGSDGIFPSPDSRHKSVFEMPG